MRDLLWLALGSMGVTALASLAWWLLIASEGVYLGRRVVIWLYDVFATRYDNIKAYHVEYEHVLLARPVMEALAPQTDPLVLDVATGTGRLPLALLEHVDFQGRVVGVDLSRKMLHMSAHKLAPAHERVDLIHVPAECLPFDDNTFDLVTCLESLEFMENPVRVLNEVVRVLRPGGLLLITNRINMPLMPGKTWTDEQARQYLREAGVVNIEFERWQADYHKVWGRKAGSSATVGAQPLSEVLRCPACGEKAVLLTNVSFLCSACEARIPLGVDGVIEYVGVSDRC